MSIIKLNNQAVKNATAFGSISSLGSMTFIKKLTASSSATLSFVDGSDGVVLDDTYKEYVFTFKDIHPATDNTQFKFQISTDSGSNYNTTMTTTFFAANHNEADNDAGLGYKTGGDQGQGTGFQRISASVGADNDQCVSGYLHLFNPSSTTFVKHFISRTQTYSASNQSEDSFSAGYGNTTSAVDAIQFKFASGNIDSGVIKLYGVS